ncbi:MAG: tetratricopeptide repeat protein [Acidobacteriota bacterium]|nr:tetratricopeptide repeat protein [Acidobacteriota bacterium]
MTQHISRKELKTDEFHDWMEHIVEVLSTHKNTIWQSLVIVAVVVGAVYGWRYYTSHQNARAWTGFSKAMEVYSAPVTGTGQTPLPGQMTYSSDLVKYQIAQKDMGQVAMEYPHTDYGRMARYYAAVSLDRLGRYQDAVNWLQPMTKGGDAQLRALATFELAHVYDHMNKPAQAVELYQNLLSKPNVFVPKPVVLMALGDHYRSQNQTQQASKYYQQIKTEFPNTGLADQADQRLEMLGKT